jgi:phage terminase small subunit
MPELRDERLERFCQAVHKGKAAHAAALSAGYAKSTAVKACWIRNRPAVDQRIRELNARALAIEGRALKAAQERYDVTTERVIGELARIGFANMQDYLLVDEHGDPRLNYAAITRDQASAIQEITIDEYKEGRGPKAKPVKRIRIKLAEKRPALEALGRHLGLWIDPSVLNLNVANFFSEAPPSMDDWRKEIEAQAVETKQLEAPLSRPMTRPGMPRREKRQRAGKAAGVVVELTKNTSTSKG